MRQEVNETNTRETVGFVLPCQELILGREPLADHNARHGSSEGTTGTPTIRLSWYQQVFTSDNLNPILLAPLVPSSCESHESAIYEEDADVLGPEDNDTSKEDKDETRNDEPTPSGNTSLSLQSGEPSSVTQSDTTYYDVDPDTTVALNLVHKLTHTPGKTYAAFSSDGKYLATVSTGKTIR